MIQVNKKDAKKVFEKLNVQEKSSKHHVSGFIVVDGVKMLPIHYSHGRGDMPGAIGKKFVKSLLLEDDEFKELVKCTLSKEKYFEILMSRINE